jgi:hypothetical protein
LGTFFPVNYAKFHPGSRGHLTYSIEQGADVQEDLLALIGRDESETFFFIEELHFAGWHDYLFLRVIHFTKRAG